jgi:hypothetical protein
LYAGRGFGSSLLRPKARCSRVLQIELRRQHQYKNPRKEDSGVGRVRERTEQLLPSRYQRFQHLDPHHHLLPLVYWVESPLTNHPASDPCLPSFPADSPDRLSSSARSQPSLAATRSLLLLRSYSSPSAPTTGEVTVPLCLQPHRHLLLGSSHSPTRAVRAPRADERARGDQRKTRRR